MTRLNLAELCPSSRSLGPGNRFILWVQGCCFNCPGCISPDWIPQTQGTLIEAKQLAEIILSRPNLDGVTVSGGEPMLQAIALSELFSFLRQKRDLSLISYSGFTLAQLQEKNNPEINKVLNYLDVLIDGLYIDDLNDNRGWRGSSNQTIHLLSDRHRREQEQFEQGNREVEIHLRPQTALMVGVPPTRVKQDFETL
ncbi:4Fe-4S single cluster domain-containing protein [Sodalinema gerasimenkoae]|uniref:4Fe-4S single cluster domain-containing protein n=1 Tax=Sodalinema gerasimenkoae TaxID=2862348 RepID=UPI0013593C52|nr:4Fe-4S single cluster domain-containing protein [Sodalinema gerasimenkoae]